MVMVYGAPATTFGPLLPRATFQAPIHSGLPGAGGGSLKEIGRDTMYVIWDAAACLP